MAAWASVLTTGYAMYGFDETHTNQNMSLEEGLISIFFYYVSNYLVEGIMWEHKKILVAYSVMIKKLIESAYSNRAGHGSVSVSLLLLFLRCETFSFLS